MTLYGRVIAVHTANRIFTNPLRITTTVRIDSSNTSDTGETILWNLNRTTEQQILERGEKIRIEAGYQNQTATIFDGQIQQITRERRNTGEPARLTRIKLGDQTRSIRNPNRTGGTLGGITSRSYRGQQTTQQITRDLIEDIGLEPGNLKLIPPNAQTVDYSASGRATDALTTLLAAHDLGWYEDSGTIRIRTRQQTSNQQPTYLYTPQTGLIGSPTITDDGVELLLQLNPLVARGSEIQVESEYYNGRVKTVTVEHTADNWAGAFQTWADCRPV